MNASKATRITCVAEAAKCAVQKSSSLPSHGSPRWNRAPVERFGIFPVAPCGVYVRYVHRSGESADSGPKSPTHQSCVNKCGDLVLTRSWFWSGSPTEKGRHL